MKHNVLAPSVGESITEVSILKWSKQNGQAVKSGELLLEIESDKATVEIVAEHSGALSITKPAGERVKVGEVIGSIDDSAQGSVRPSPQPSAPPPSMPKTPPPASLQTAPTAAVAAGPASPAMP